MNSTKTVCTWTVTKHVRLFVGIDSDRCATDNSSIYYNTKCSIVIKHVLINCSYITYTLCKINNIASDILNSNMSNIYKTLRQYLIRSGSYCSNKCEFININILIDRLKRSCFLSHNGSLQREVMMHEKIKGRSIMMEYYL